MPQLQVPPVGPRVRQAVGPRVQQAVERRVQQAVERRVPQAAVQPPERLPRPPRKPP